jgi:hypothetical protein
VTERGPGIVAWTDHALVKAQLLGVPQTDIEEAILSGHEQRRRNTGAADWLVVSGRIAIAYNYPADDELTALIVTLWRQD